MAAQSLFINGTLQTQTHMYVYNKTSIIYTNWREGLSELTKNLFYYFQAHDVINHLMSMWFGGKSTGMGALSTGFG